MKNVLKSFPIDTNGVSGVYCGIRKTANGIPKLGSSYGTHFTVGGSEEFFRIKH